MLQSQVTLLNLASIRTTCIKCVIFNLTDHKVAVEALYSVLELDEKNTFSQERKGQRLYVFHAYQIP
jgi:hypothetical protein